MATLAQQRRPAQVRRSWRRNITVGQVLIWIVLSLVFLAVAYPFFYVLSLAVMP